METFSALLALCERNPPLTGGFPSQRPVTQSFGVFFDLRMNKRLSKQSGRRWFEMPSCSLWRHFNKIGKSQKTHHIAPSPRGTRSVYWEYLGETIARYREFPVLAWVSWHPILPASRLPVQKSVLLNNWETSKYLMTDRLRGESTGYCERDSHAESVVIHVMMSWNTSYLRCRCSV